MGSAGVPDAAWGWRRTAVVVGVALLPVLSIGVSFSGKRASSATAGFDALVVGPALLVTALGSYAAWRLRPRTGLAWATFGLAALATQNLVGAAARLFSHEGLPGLRVLAADLTAAVLVLTALGLTHVIRRRPDPAATGFGLGALVAVCRQYWFDADPHLGQNVQGWLLCCVYLATLFTVSALLSWGGGLTPRIGSIPRWVRQRTALAIVMVGIAHLALYFGDSVLSRVTVFAGDTVGTVLLISTYLAHFLEEVEAGELSRSNLTDELERAKRGARAHRALMHEIKSTIAGITSASQLLGSSEDIGEGRRNVLQEMIRTELGRLERLVAPPDRALSGDRSADLDATIGPLVVSHEARGTRVRWSPSGWTVPADPDAVAEIVNVLLDNAAKHGRSGAEVTVTKKGGFVEVVVHDDGPGIDASLRRGLFDWGVRGPRSTGQGIGLDIARHLAERQHGYLRLRDTGRTGATFVLGLPLSADDRTDVDGAASDDSTLQPGHA